jgi:hypothetical protein
MSGNGSNGCLPGAECPGSGDASPGSGNGCQGPNCPNAADACTGADCPQGSGGNACPSGNCPGSNGGGVVDAGAVDAFLPTIDLPFSYEFVDGGVEINTDAGPVFPSIGPWGAHFIPDTGHELGDSKSNIQGYFAQDYTTLTQVDGGPCTLGEQCQVAESIVTSRRPTYLAPLDGTITRVSISPPVGTVYYPDTRHFQVEYHGGGYNIVYDHVYSTAESLRQAILGATGVDTDTWEPDGGTGTLTLSVPVLAGDEVAHPQIVAAPSPNAGYLVGGPTDLMPWAQMEVFYTSEATGYDICLYDHVAPATENALQNILDAEMLSPTSVRYWSSMNNMWQWASEGAICMMASVGPSDFSSLFTHLGGTWWTLQSEPGALEAIAFPHIATTSLAYRPSLYSPGVDTLIVHARPNQPGEPPFVGPTPDGGTLQGTLVYGEVLTLGSSDMLLHWRLYSGSGVMNPPDAPDVYQSVAYYLDPNTGLKLRWGTPTNDSTTATVAIVSASDACDGVTVLCYDHTENPLY